MHSTRQSAKQRRKSVEEKASKSQAIKWLRELKEAIPKGSDGVSAKTLDIWGSRLARISQEVLAAAALVLIERNTFFPSLAEILEVCREITCEGRIPNAGEAYEEVTTAMRRVGYWNPCPEFSHPAVGKALRAIGGWRYLCSSENSVSDRARFYESYERLREQSYREETMPELSKQVAAKYLKRLEAKAASTVARAEGARLPGRKEVGSPNTPGKPRSSLQNVVPLRPVSTTLLGEEMTAEEWEEHKSQLKESAGGA